MDRLSGSLRMLKLPKLVAQRSPPPAQSSPAGSSPTLESDAVNPVVPILPIKRRTLRKRRRSSVSTPPVSPKTQDSLSTPTTPIRHRGARNITKCDISSPQMLGIPQAFEGLESASSSADSMANKGMQDESLGTPILDELPVPAHVLTTPNVRTGQVPAQRDNLPTRRNINKPRELMLRDSTVERWLQRRNEEDALFAPGSAPARQRIQRSSSNGSFSRPRATACADIVSLEPVSEGSSAGMPTARLGRELENHPEEDDEGDDWTISAKSGSESPSSSLRELPNYGPYHPDILRVVRGPAYVDALEAARRPTSFTRKLAEGQSREAAWHQR